MLFRLSYGVIGRLPRVTPEPGTVFNGYAVPAGVCLSLQFLLHANPFSTPQPVSPTNMHVDYRRNELVDDASKRKHIPLARQV